MTSAENQGMLWGAEAEDWAKLFEPFNEPIWIAMLDSTGVAQETRFLDLGCGGGGASVLASERGAKVTGLDAAKPLIEFASKRVSSGDFRVGDLENLPYIDNRFDVAFASLSIMFAKDALSVVREMRRVTIPDGHVTISIWGNPEECEYRFILKAVADTLPSPPTGKGPFFLSKTGALEEIIEAAELEVVDSGDVDAPFQFSDSEIMWRMVRSAGPVQAALRVISEPELKASVIRVAKRFQNANGEILLNNRFRYVTAIV
ncbi:MAG: methyltransferase domain-containing protein [candidate division Zixibacteria bacterium]|nr:class I SAM-dependent methyltransferase [candidate division Zixibacteria bacterium]NIR49287.1 class I SAM-dependent methyltransferase [candidate division KSB1 bacterium]NIS46347.1 class I SAM-dependent methyltransferase [candidate division Zixibacteria bacterium]NIU14436.1 class I SAM-dependent methyltransferase [candidate division Zixibacteria bacterium]NIV06464.1 methyltransferase domain-containing protein [candidate division Zixibacteria bacterium]